MRKRRTKQSSKDEKGKQQVQKLNLSKISQKIGQVKRISKETWDYHDAKCQVGDDGIFDGDGGELQIADKAGEGLGEGTQRVLANRRENGRTSQMP